MSSRTVGSTAFLLLLWATGCNGDDGPRPRGADASTPVVPRMDPRDPSAGEALLPRGATLAEERRAAGFDDRVHARAALGTATRASLGEAGIDLLQWVVDDVWNVSIPRSGLATVGRSGLRWAVLPTPAMKHGPQLARPRPDQRGADGRIRWRVRFHRDVTYDEAIAALVAAGVEPIAPTERRYAGLQFVDAWAEVGGIERVLERDAVSWVSPTSRPKSAHDMVTRGVLRVGALHAPPAGLTGAGVAVGVWDQSRIDAHPDFAIAPANVDGPAASALLDHATHVAGVLGGSGTNDPTGAAGGMAPGVTLEGHDWDDDLTEMIESTTVLSNHSYGPRTGWSSLVDGGWGWEDDQDLFGDYDDDSRDMDALVTNFDRTIVVAAGNDRDDVDPSGPASRPRDCTQDNRSVDANCIGPGAATAKNTITVGAIDRTGTATAVAAFSSFGPTDDGRIKPDVVAPGVQIRTTDFGSVYQSPSGTSFATPAITGGIALLRERAAQLGLNLRPSSYKALLVQSARDVAGTNAGPDYWSGWGIPDFAAADRILTGPAGPCIIELTLGPGGGFTLPVVVRPGEQTLRVTLAWDDPAPFIIGLDAMLSHDIDLALIDPTGGIHGPWILDPNRPELPATTNPSARDRRNNVEQVEVTAPQAGQWLAVVTVARMPLFSSQVVSLTRVSLIDTIDGDQHGSCVDNCPLVPNDDQGDLNANGLGDACDPDDDSDGVADATDDCPRVADPAQLDTDADGRGDACDEDDDDDSIPDVSDNCPVIANGGQENADLDAWGDACDDDDDNDGVPDTTDNCRSVFNPDQANHDPDALGDACDPDDDNDCVGDARDNCVFQANCNFCSPLRDPGLCTDPCIPRSPKLLWEVGRFFQFCVVGGEMDPKCRIDGCSFPQLDVRDPVELRRRFVEMLSTPLGRETGIRIRDDGRLVFPRAMDGVEPPGPSFLDAPVPVRASGPAAFASMSRASRQLSCAAIFDGLVKRASAAASFERLCRAKCQAQATMCQRDSDGDGLGDACDP